jgi:hypothetical protein
MDVYNTFHNKYGSPEKCKSMGKIVLLSFRGSSVPVLCIVLRNNPLNATCTINNYLTNYNDFRAESLIPSRFVSQLYEVAGNLRKLDLQVLRLRTDTNASFQQAFLSGCRGEQFCAQYLPTLSSYFSYDAKTVEGDLIYYWIVQTREKRDNICIQL